MDGFVALRTARARARYGARIFIPKQFLPTKYDYRRSISVSDHAESLENSLHGRRSNVFNLLEYCKCTRGKYFVTPCDHFSTKSAWKRMNVKHECPVCRTNYCLCNPSASMMKQQEDATNANYMMWLQSKSYFVGVVRTTQ